MPMIEDRKVIRHFIVEEDLEAPPAWRPHGQTSEAEEMMGHRHWRRQARDAIAAYRKRTNDAFMSQCCLNWPLRPSDIARSYRQIIIGLQRILDSDAYCELLFERPA